MGLWARIKGSFNGLSGSQAAVAGVEPVAAGTLRQALLSFASPDQSWSVRARDNPHADLEATWKFDDPHWAPQLRKAGVPAVRILMRLHEDVHVIRSVDEQFSVSWENGIGLMGLSASYSRGQQYQMRQSWNIRRGADGHWHMIPDYDFDTDDIKNALRKLVTERGWSWRGMLTGSL